MQNCSTEDTIAAISTAPGEAAIGIVRLSGKDALKIAERVFISPTGRALSTSHRICYGCIIDPDTGEQIDEALVTFMKAPRTYTREDIVEINCHGGFIATRRVLELLLRNGARAAEPGEFTKRAFLNGRIDLTQAEAVLDLIRAKTDKAERLAMAQLKGALRRKITPLREKLIDISAQIEAQIDFPEEDIEPTQAKEIQSEINAVINDLSALLKTYDEGRLFREGLKTAIIGRPNVGKSSLLNALLEAERAIVTELPGTTRDVIEEYLNLKGLPVRIMDTAGIRQAHDMAEAEGVRRSLCALEDADAAIVVIDSSVPLHKEDIEVLEKVGAKPHIVALNKCDLPEADISLPEGHNAIRISAKTGEGIDALKEAVFNLCIKETAADGDAVLTNARHKVATEDAIQCLEAALSALSSGLPLEIVALELKGAVQSLSALIGAITADDVLNRIFSRFCIGK